MEKTLLLQFLLPVVIHGNLYISDTESMSPSGNCGLATPKITFNREGNFIDVDEKDLNISEGQTLWVGYQQNYHSFFYKGCSKLDDVTFGVSAEILVDPGQCYSFCQNKTAYIGLTKEKCYCISKIKNKKLNENCSFNCANQESLICGGEDDRVSVYDPGALPISQNEGHFTRFCLAVDPISRKLIWSSCTESNQFLCMAGSDIKILDSWNSWASIMQLCLAEGLPVQPPISGQLGRGGSLWTGNVRSYSITTGTGVRQGFLTKSNGKLYLGFEQPTTLRKSLCDWNISWSSGSPEKDSTITSTLSMVSSSSVPNYQEAIESSNNVAVYVAVPLVVILIVFLLGIVFFWIKRKRQIKNTSRLKESDPKPETQHKTKAQRVTYNPSYESSVRSSGKVTHDYFELEPDASYATVEDTTDPLEDYDTTAQTHASRNVNKAGNEYNTFKDFLEDPYNHTEEANKQADDTYNHCNAKGKKDDGTYDKVNVGNVTSYGDGDNDGRGSGVKEDSYSHIEKRDFR